jgi:hypothetical protein
VLLLMWSGGCILAALSSVAVTGSGGPWLLGAIAIALAQLTVLSGRAARLPSQAIWPVAIGFASAGAVGRGGLDLALYVGVVGAMLAVVNRFAALAVDLSAFCLPGDDAGGRRTLHTTTLADPVAREFARARRYESPLTVASIAVPNARGASRRLARIAGELVPSLRRTDAIVRALTNRLVVVLPGGDDDVAVAVLSRVLAGHDTDVLVGTATFPHDGATWASLKDVARAREEPWPRIPTAPAAESNGRFSLDRAGMDQSAEGVP